MAAVIAVLVAGAVLPLVPSPPPAAAAPLTSTIVLHPTGPDRAHVAVTATTVSPTVSWTNRSGQTLHITDDLGLLDSGPVPDDGTFHAAIPIPGSYTWSSEVGGGTVVVTAPFDGAGTDLALDSLPRIAFPSRPANDVAVHPDLLVEASRTRAVVRFSSTATVAQAAEALNRASVDLVAALPNIGLALVMVRSTPTSFSVLDQALRSLRGHAAVDAAVPDVVVVDQELPAPTAIADRWSWFWEPPSVDPNGVGTNWGHEISRVPAAWNLSDAIGRRPTSPMTAVVIDSGFEEHENLPRMTIAELCSPRFSVAGIDLGQACTVDEPSDHGNHVAGIMGAGPGAGTAIDPSIGTVGVDPYSDIVAVNRVGLSDDLWTALSLTLTELEAGRMGQPRVINISSAMAYAGADQWTARWRTRRCGPGANDDAGSSGPCLPQFEDGRIAFANSMGTAMRGVIEDFVTKVAEPPLFVFAAGNNSDGLCNPLGSACTERVPLPVEAMSEAAVASRDWDHSVGPNPILVVESIGTYTANPGGGQSPTPGPARSLFSNIGGHLSAPGLATSTESSAPGNTNTGCTTDRNSHCFMNGTSMAAPFVSGVAGLLLAWDPTLTAAELRAHLLEFTVADTTGGAAPRTDAYLALTALPGVAHALADLNDPSADGNRRVIRAADGSTTLDEVRSTVAGQHTEPDGTVDLRDFRRFRDAWLARCSLDHEAGCPADVVLDGPLDHPKRDLNHDGRIAWVAPGAKQIEPSELTWSRFDLNGDGEVSLTRRALVGLTPEGRPAPTAAEATMMTDLEVLASQWDGTAPGAEGIAATELHDLMVSGDLEVHVAALGLTGAPTAEIVVTSGGSELSRRAVRSGDASVLVTVPAEQPVEVTVTGTAPAGVRTYRTEPMRLTAGEDRRVDLCGALSLEVAPGWVRPDGATAEAVATVRTCDADPSGITVTFSLTEELPDGARLSSTTASTDAQGRATVTIDGGTTVADYQVAATAYVPTGAGQATAWRTAVSSLRVSQPYELDVVATTSGASGYESLYQVSAPGRDLPGPSINAQGQVAFSAGVGGRTTALVADGSTLATQPATAVDVFPRTSMPAGAAFTAPPLLNDAGQVVGTFRYDGDDPGHLRRGIFVGSSDGSTAPHEVVTSVDATFGPPVASEFDWVADPALANTGDVLFHARRQADGYEALVRAQGTGFEMGAAVPVSAAVRLADDGTSVALVSGNIAVGAGIQTDRGSLASSTNGWADLGRPAIADDGQVVAFTADRDGAGAALWLALRSGPDALHWQAPIAVAGGGRTGELGTGAGGAERHLTVAVPRSGSLTNPLNFGTRPGVVHVEAGPAGLDGDRILVAYQATPNGAGEGFTDQPGLWTQVIDVVADGGTYRLEPQRPTSVVQRGATLAGGVVRFVSIGDSLARPADAAGPAAHQVAFAVETADPADDAVRHHHVIRATWSGSGATADAGASGAAAPGFTVSGLPSTPSASVARSASSHLAAELGDDGDDLGLAASAGDDGEMVVLDGPHVAAFTLPDGTWVQGGTGTVINRSRHYDGTPSWAMISTSSGQASLVAPNAAHLAPVVDGPGYNSQRVQLVSGPGYGGTTLGVNVLVVNRANRAPSITVKDPVIVAIGSGATLTATTSDPDTNDSSTVTWDLDDDGTFDRTGATISLTAAELDALVCGGSCAQDQEHRIRVRATDRAGLWAEATSTVRISSQATFALDAQPRLLQANPGSTAYGYATITGIDGFDQSVELRFEDVPAGWVTSVPAVLARPGEATFSIRPAADAADDRFDLTLVATSGTQVERRTITVATPFALIPRCSAVVSGTVRDAVTGEPLDRLYLWGAGQTLYPVGAEYRAVYQLPVGHTSSSTQMNVSRADYYEASATTPRLSCGDEVTLDLEMQPFDRGTAKVQVMEAVASPIGDGAAVTGTPVSDVRVQWSGSNTETTSASEGHAVLVDLPINNQAAVRQVSLVLSKPGYHTRTVTARYGPDLVADFGAVGLLRECSVTISGGRVVDELGEPWVGATVSLTGGGWARSTDADGRYPDNVVPLSYPNRPLETLSLGVRLPIAGASTVYTRVPSVSCGMTTEPITIVVPRPVEPEKHYGTVTGVVLDEETGEPIVGAEVSLMSNMDATHRRTTTDDEGRFRYDEVLVGAGDIAQTNVWLGVSGLGYRGWSPGIKPYFTLSSGGSTHRRLEMLPHRYGTMEGHVYDLETGEALANVPIAVGPATNTSRRTDSSGYYVHSQIELTNTNGRVSAGATVSQFGHANGKTYFTTSSPRQWAEADEPVTQDLYLTPRCFGSKVSGTVVDATDLSPIAAVMVSVPNGALTYTDADGRFTLNQVLAGSFNASRTTTVTATKAGYGSTSRQITVFCDGDITVDFGQPSGGFGMIVGQVTDGNGAPMPDVEIGAGFGESIKTDDEGRYRFERAPLTPEGDARTWPVTARRGFDSQQASVTVRAGEETVQDFRFDALNTPPETSDVDVTTTGTDPVAVTLTGFDADGDPLVYEVRTGPSHGALSGTAPDLTYTADDDFTGTDTFTFEVSDGIDRAEATVTVTVLAPEDETEEPPLPEEPEPPVDDDDDDPPTTDTTVDGVDEDPPTSGDPVGGAVDDEPTPGGPVQPDPVQPDPVEPRPADPVRTDPPGTPPPADPRAVTPPGTLARTGFDPRGLLGLAALAIGAGALLQWLTRRRPRSGRGA